MRVEPNKIRRQRYLEQTDRAECRTPVPLPPRPSTRRIRRPIEYRRNSARPLPGLHPTEKLMNEIAEASLDRKAREITRGTRYSYPEPPLPRDPRE